MLVQRRRWWANSKLEIGQRLVFAGGGGRGVLNLHSMYVESVPDQWQSLNTLSHFARDT